MLANCCHFNVNMFVKEPYISYTNGGQIKAKSKKSNSLVMV